MIGLSGLMIATAVIVFLMGDRSAMPLVCLLFAFVFWVTDQVLHEIRRHMM